MPSTFDDAFADDALPDLLDEFGVAVVWHVHDGGGDIDTVAIPQDFGTRRVPTPDGGTRLARRLRLTVPVADVPAPHVDDTVTYDGDLYAVIEPDAHNGASTDVECGRWAGGEDSFEGLREALAF